MKTATIIGLSALGIAGAFYFGKTKYEQYKNIVDHLQIKPEKLHNVKFKDSKLTFEADVRISNPTTNALNIPGNQLVLKQINLSNAGKHLATAILNLTDLNIEANGSRLLVNVPVVADLNSGMNLMELLNLATNLDALQIKVDFELFGKPFSI